MKAKKTLNYANAIFNRGNSGYRDMYRIVYNAISDNNLQVKGQQILIENVNFHLLYTTTQQILSDKNVRLDVCDNNTNKVLFSFTKGKLITCLMNKIDKKGNKITQNNNIFSRSYVKSWVCYMVESLVDKERYNKPVTNNTNFIRDLGFTRIQLESLAYSIEKKFDILFDTSKNNYPYTLDMTVDRIMSNINENKKTSANLDEIFPEKRFLQRMLESQKDVYKK